ncbi:three prime repair exonuclease 2-like [Diadema setosum]|uniref:three prime repair exonuclease 2-like n=1 Tax=Diadema setosum TaxID=31175 RepID=UPI003B3B0C07
MADVDSVMKEKIKSFAFLDLETTGLAEPKITELSIAVVHREALLSAHAGVVHTGTGERVQPQSLRLPRIVDTLSLCFDPDKEIESCVSKLTGLHNKDLRRSKKMVFEKHAVDAVNALLGRQEKPVCLVAHYGDKFDFLVIRTELQGLSLHLDPDVLSVDTVPAFRHFSTIRHGGRPADIQLNGNPYVPHRYISCKLRDIYLRKLGSAPKDPHSAMEDVYTLMRVVIADAQMFVEWADENAETFF